jgi:hypothetical protein
MHAARGGRHPATGFKTRIDHVQRLRLGFGNGVGGSARPTPVTPGVPSPSNIGYVIKLSIKSVQKKAEKPRAVRRSAKVHILMRMSLRDETHLEPIA